MPKRLEFRCPTDWKAWEKREGHTRTTWQELVWREWGSAGQAIQNLMHRNEPVTLENILRDCELYDRQEGADSPLWFIGGEYARDRVLLGLGKLIECGIVWSVEVDIPPETEGRTALGILLNAYAQAGVDWVCRSRKDDQGREWSYVFLVAPDQKTRVQEADLDLLLLIQRFMEFRDGELVSY